MPKFNDLTGKKFGKLFVFQRNHDNPRYWDCKCDCGTIKPVMGTHLTGNKTVSCGCYATERNRKTAQKLWDTHRNRRPLIQCLQCGSEFRKPHPRSRYCSKACYTRAQRRTDADHQLIFWSRVHKTAGCWMMHNTTKNHPYGRYQLNGKQQDAHRVAWILTFGDIPDGMDVCHHCDTPGCVNPSHLFLGTHQDNMDDMVRKKRHTAGGAKGVNHQNAKLDADKVRFIRSSPLSNRRLGAMFDVSSGVIGAIKRRELWAHVD